MNVSQYIAKYLSDLGVKKAFGITGSAVATLFDEFAKSKRIELIYPIHEQAAAMSADAYARTSGTIGVAISTSGPGATNLITGICCSWFDSVPTLFLTGQVNSQFTKGDLPIKQIGFQETDIVSMIRSVTKYAVMVKDPQKIKYELEKAVYYATTGRPGPVLIDLPMDIQKADINPHKLSSYKPEKLFTLETPQKIEAKIDSFLKDLRTAKRPVILIGGGVVHAKVQKEVRDLLKKLKIPAVVTWPAIDVLEETFSYYRGRIGTYGQRGANFTFQNADLVLSLGSRHDGRQTGGRIDSFAREAKRYMVDIDSNELKHQQVKGHVNINDDLHDFIPRLLKKVVHVSVPSFASWLTETKKWQKKYPTVLSEYKKTKGRIHGYAFMEVLSDCLEENDILVGDCGGNIVQLAQAFKIKKGQQIVTAWAHSPMGYAFAATFGAYYGKHKNVKHVVCTVGDGGMQVNLQELQTLKMYNIPMKVFIINNNSFGIIKQYQDIYLDSRYVNAAPGHGYTVPDFIKVAKAFGLHTESIRNLREAKKKIKKVLAYNGPVICDVATLEETVLIPRLGWNTGIEDQYPPLPREELHKNLYIQPLDEDKKR